VESIVGTADRLVSPDWSRRVARERLGVEPVEIPTGHFPMITHPELLAGELAKLDAE
jgi:pimeloyl-ACP methyl ester carboxylesterase